MTKIQRLVLAVLVLFLCTGFDQMTKGIAREELASADPISLFNDTIRIVYSENTGATLGMGANLPEGVRFALFVLLNGLISITTLIAALKMRELRLPQMIGLLLVASGGL
ncbi:MAG TPA: signal peptidase II, partial [Anaerolineales bacterium]|nr:signal peptidase II [Anaerolineales bacterium]